MYKRKSRWRRILTILISVILLLSIIGLIGRKIYVHYAYPMEYSSTIQKYAEEYGVSDDLVRAVIDVESGYKTDAVSDAGAIGLMQMTRDAFNWINEYQIKDSTTFDELYDADTSIRYGTCLLAVLLDHYDGNVTNAIAAYHAGMGSVDSWLELTKNSSDGENLDSIPRSDTEYYVAKVTKAMTMYQKLTQK